MARHFCALLLVFGLAAATYARPEARLAGGAGIGPAAEHAATAAPVPGHVPRQGCGKKAMSPPSARADVMARIAAAALRLLTHVSQLPALWLERHGVDHPRADELKAAIEDLWLCVAEAYRGVTGVIGVG